MPVMVTTSVVLVTCLPGQSLIGAQLPIFSRGEGLIPKNPVAFTACRIFLFFVFLL